MLTPLRKTALCALSGAFVAFAHLPAATAQTSQTPGAPATPAGRCFHLAPTGPDALPTYTGTPLAGAPQVQVLAAETQHFCPIIMSIYGNILDMIAAGQKTYEYRKSFPSEPASQIIYYDNTAKTIRGFVTIVRTLMGPPSAIVDLTWTQSGVSSAALMGYFGKYTTGFATEFRDYHAFAQPLAFADVQMANPGFDVPRGYSYLENYEKLQEILKPQILQATNGSH